MAKALPEPNHTQSCQLFSQGQHTLVDVWPLSRNGSTSEAFTPSSSQGTASRSTYCQSVPSDPDFPLPSTEQNMNPLGASSVNLTVSPPPAHDGLTPPVVVALNRLQLEGHASAMPNGRDSLSPGPRLGSPLPSRRHRRSSSVNRIQCHEVDQEDPPDSRFYSLGFQRVLSQAKDLARNLANEISSGNLHTDEKSIIHGLHSRAKDASCYRSPETLKIGLVGNSGAGKSSLVNSLLDIKNFAKVGDSGEACTCVATEYHYHNLKTYTIEVVYFTKERLLEQFKTHLKAYRRCHLHRAEDDEEKRDLGKAASIAWHAFEAAFRNQNLLTKAYMLQENEQVLIDNFSSWIDGSAPLGYHEAAKHLSYIRRESIVDQEECSNRVMQLTSERSDGEVAASWPYIERVVVYLNAHILKGGLVLVDLPGLHDTNMARRMITERYIVNCDEVFAVSQIGRAITDAAMPAVIDLAKKTKRKSVGIVCTRSDDIAPEEAERDWTYLPATILRQLMKNVREDEESLNVVSEELDFELDSTKKRELFEEREIYKKQLRQDKYLLQRHLITTRNKDVISKLNQKYHPVVQKVFCVSNRMYSTERNKDVKFAQEWLDLSEIISLRKYCLELVAEHQLRDACAFIRDVIPNLVSSIDLWVQSGSIQISLETRAQIRKASQEMEEILQHELGGMIFASNKIYAELYEIFHDQVRSQFTTQNYENWREIADKAATTWATWYHPTYNAFCRKFGDYMSDAVGYHCWNEEIITGMTKSLTQEWEMFRQRVRDFFRLRGEMLHRLFAQALHPLQAIHPAVSYNKKFDSVKTLIKTILYRKAQLLLKFQRIATEYDNALSRLGNSEFLSPIRTSFIGQYMESAYRDAAEDAGRGVAQRRLTIINRRVKDPNLFKNIKAKLEERFETLTCEVGEKILLAYEAEFSAICEALDTLRNENAIREAECNAEFRERMEMQVAAAQHILRMITAEVQNSGQ